MAKSIQGDDMRKILGGLLGGLLVVSSVCANDTVVEIAAGGLEYVRSDKIEMVREDLYISMDEVRVDYVFRNHSEEDITAMVAFPMPNIQADPYSDIGLPFAQYDNFLGFRVFVEGQEIEPRLQQRAKVIGVDVTTHLVKRNITLLPTGDGVFAALNRQSPDVLLELEQLGIVEIENYEGGNGLQAQINPQWVLQSAYYWEMVFPAGKEIKVSHTYSPATGATTGIAPFFYGEDDISEEYVRRYCVDEGFVRAVSRKVDAGTQYFETWISYILVTGRNWYRTIGTFHLTVDKGSTNNLVSFCGEGVVKTGPTTFELTIEDYYPEKNSDVLVMLGVDY